MQLQLDPNKKEVKAHETYGFPVNVSLEQLSRYEKNSFLWHWHREVELTLVLSGEMCYQLNETVYHLSAGDGLFCNSNTMHTGFPDARGDDCSYISVTFHPRFLCGYEGSVLQTKYVEKITENPAIPGLRLSPSSPWQLEILTQLKNIFLLSRKPPQNYELLLQIDLLSIWNVLWEHGDFQNVQSPASTLRHMDRLRKILEYIQQHYSEKITLEDIAAQASICQSECCRFFKKHMKESLFDYLISFRIEKSLPLLRETDLPVTEIAGRVGFSTSAYYAKVFRERMRCTPTRYREM